ncbi:hypothetical protein JXI42_02865 [bacterium]|nr:hypothetical protein [bacterium]
METLLRKKTPWQFIHQYFDDDGKITITPSQNSEPVKLTIFELEDVIINKKIKRSSLLHNPQKNTWGLLRTSIFQFFAIKEENLHYLEEWEEQRVFLIQSDLLRGSEVCHLKDIKEMAVHGDFSASSYIYDPYNNRFSLVENSVFNFLLMNFQTHINDRMLWLLTIDQFCHYHTDAVALSVADNEIDTLPGEAESIALITDSYIEKGDMESAQMTILKGCTTFPFDIMLNQRLTSIFSGGSIPSAIKRARRSKSYLTSYFKDVLLYPFENALVAMLMSSVIISIFFILKNFFPVFFYLARFVLNPIFYLFLAGFWFRYFFPILGLILVGSVEGIRVNDFKFLDWKFFSKKGAVIILETLAYSLPFLIILLTPKVLLVFIAIPLSVLYFLYVYTILPIILVNSLYEKSTELVLNPKYLIQAIVKMSPGYIIGLLLGFVVVVPVIWLVVFLPYIPLIKEFAVLFSMVYYFRLVGLIYRENRIYI